MIKQNFELKNIACNALSGQWMIAAVIILLLALISSSLTAIEYVGLLLSIFLIIPLSWSVTVIFLNLSRGVDIRLENMLDGFKDYGRILGTMFLKQLYLFFWTLLLIVPGIIKSYSYAMTEFLLKDEPALSNNAAIEKSMAMMQGHKMRLFLLDLSFVGWFILSILSLGIGFLFLMPYVTTTHAVFYENLKAELANDSMDVK